MSLLRHYRQLRRTVRELTDADNDALPRWQRALLYAIELGRFAGEKLEQDRASQMAAALTYHTLFSLLPTLVLTLVVAGAFVSDERLNELKAGTVTWVVHFLEDEPSRQATHPTESNANPTNPANQRRAEFDRAADRLDEQLTEWLDQLEQIDFRSISLFGVLLFIYAATKLLSTIESSFNLVLRAEENRSWYVRVPLYYTTLTLAPVVLLAGQWTQQQFIELLQQSGAAVAWFAGPLVVLSPLLTAWLVLLLAYRLLPNARLHLRPAAVGSFVAALGLGLAVEAFALYARKTASTNLYGALALLPLFLLLLWAIWQIVLFGLEIASIIQFAPDPAERRKQRAADLQDGPRVLDPRLIVPALIRFAHAFRDGQPLTADQLAQGLNLPTASARPLLQTLLNASHIHAVDRAEHDPARFALQRAPESIRLAELMHTARQAGRPGTPDELGHPLAISDAAEDHAVQDRTLADLLRSEPHGS